jgi:hypothetical protein
MDMSISADESNFRFNSTANSTSNNRRSSRLAGKKECNYCQTPFLFKKKLEMERLNLFPVTQQEQQQLQLIQHFHGHVTQNFFYGNYKYNFFEVSGFFQVCFGMIKHLQISNFQY